MSAPDGAGTTVSRKRSRFGPRQVFALVVVAAVVVFVVQNRDEVRVYLFTATLSAPLWLLLAIMTVVGILVGLLLRWRGRKARRG